MCLKEVFRGRKTNVLDFRVCNKANDFSMTPFSQPQKGRLIIRTDPITKDLSQTMANWVNMPRLNVGLRNQPIRKTESLVRQWMRQVSKTHPKLNFIVHKVRSLKEYESSVQININLKEGAAVISVTKAKTDKFRDEETKDIMMRVDEHGKLRRNIGTKNILPNRLQIETISALTDIIAFAQKTDHKLFETSFVTYKDAPNTPEFYDLIFGKKR